MSDTEQNNQPRTEWGPIIKDMLILIIVMGGLGALCKLAMLPFQEDNPSEDLISIASKGNVNEATGKDEAFEKELAVCLEEVENFSTSADKDGRTPLTAVKFGFRNAGRAVADSNITTLIAAVVLMIFGTGTIKGFAITLTISVIVSLFTAVVVTRGLLILICKLGINNRKAYTR